MPAALVPAQGTPQNPLGAVHAQLRGRYLLTAVIAGVLAVIGAVAGFAVPHPGYASTGTIKISPMRPTTEGTVVMPAYIQYMQTVVAELQTEELERKAMELGSAKDPKSWKYYRPGPPDTYLGEWKKCLLVKLVPNSECINITFTDDHKDAQAVAPVAVRNLIKAYTEQYGDDTKIELSRKIKYWTDQKNQLDERIAAAEAQVTDRLQNIGDDPQTVYEKRLEQQIALEQKVRADEEQLRIHEDDLQKALKVATKVPYTVEDFARVDPVMQERYHQRTLLETEVQELELRLGKNNPATIASRERLLVWNQMIASYVDTLQKKFFIVWTAGTGGTLVARDLSTEEASVKRERDLYNQQQQILQNLGLRSREVASLRKEIALRTEDRNLATKMCNELTTEREMAETYQVVDAGGMAMLANDKRIAFSALGFLLGGGLPVGLLLMASLVNPKFRFSDEATGKPGPSGLTLLGILPDLPDRLSDPEQASIAAHCVHQIRTMLQINTGTDDRRVFAITSAAPGDGKTSLTLALGLSYAACGTRTLLIDCDLIGAGLTARLNVSATEGVLEAIAHRSLLDYVRSTDIADVSILPVGKGQNLHASTLSPAALRRLLEEAKKHFDTILVDTGPVLGSIEASLVAAAADAVVLTVSRGQQRPLVEKTVSHLQHIKANLAGVVFNRAQTADFDRSISGLSLRSQVNTTNIYNGSRMGPVARAVQSAFKPAGEEIDLNS